MRFVPLIAASALLTLLATGATAGENDFRLNGIKDGDGILFTRDGNAYVPNEREFGRFVSELAFVLAPRLASPAETLGHSGFHVSAMWSGSFISQDQDYWSLTTRGQRGEAPASALQTLQLDVRKGLPFSFELGANFMWLIDSEIFAPGLEVRWALQEGYSYLPDFGVRGSVSHMVGNRDLLLTTIGLDLVLSKGFGVLGMVHLAPYVSWSFVMIAANSRVIDPTPTTEVLDATTGLQRADIENNFVFDTISPSLSDLNHKLTFGMRSVFYIVNLSVQGEFQMFGEGGAFGPVATVSTKLGLDF